MCRFFFAASLSLLVVVTACSEDNSEYQAQRQELVDAIYADMADEGVVVGGLDLTDESRCLAEGVVSAFSDSRFVELGLDTAAATVSIEEVFDDVELTAGEEDEIVEVVSSCVDWGAFTVAGFTEGLVEEGMTEEAARCVVESISEESIDAFADAMINWMSTEISGQDESSAENSLVAASLSIGAEIERAMPLCIRLG